MRPANHRRACEPLLIATCAEGIVCALAPSLPWPVGRITLVIGLAAWIGTAVWTVASAVPRLIDRRVRSAEMLVGAAAMTTAVVHASALGLVQLSGRSPHLSWNIDWRFHLNHAQTVARHGSLDRALEYAGAPIDYHVGPAWIAGAVESLTGRGLVVTTHLALPALATITIAAALVAMLSASGVPTRISSLAAGLAMTMPLLIVEIPDLLGSDDPSSEIFDMQNWMVAPSLMQNAFFGIAVGLAAVALLCMRPPMARTTGTLAAIAIGSLFATKPQLFPSALLLATLTGASRSRAFVSRRNLLTLSGTVLSAAAFAAISTDASLFGAPRLRWFDTGDVPLVWVHGGMAAVAIAIGVVVARHQHRQLREVALVLGGLVAVWLGLELVQIPYSDDLVARGIALGLPVSTAAAQRDVAQGLSVLELVLVAVAISVLVRVMMTSARGRWAILVVGVVIATAPLPSILRSTTSPQTGYEAARDVGLATVLDGIDRSRSLLISNDIADPAQDYARGLRAPLLTAYGGHSFLVANLAYRFWAQPDAARRVDDLRRFFERPWSSWHEEWLRDTHVTHVLVHDRCLPAWWSEDLTEVRRSAGRWTVVPSNELSELVGSATRRSARLPRYGRSPCLGVA